jgi:hypothetical protein
VARVKIVGYTTEPVPVAERGKWGKRKDTWNGYSPPKEAKPGDFTISMRNNSRRYAIELHNLALENGLESQLARYAPTAYIVTIRVAPGGTFTFQSDTLIPGIDMPRSDGRI